ncbi:hypothetical protein RFI_33492, partial [Reticulomyxa filosa]
MEALLESGPQALLQIVYVLVKDNTFGASPSDALVFISLIFSVLTLSSRLVFDDQYLFVPNANKMFPPSPAFLFRAFFRFCEVTARLLTLAYIWVIFGGRMLYVWWMVQIVILFIFYKSGYLGVEFWNVFGYV